jgi:adenine-specific DNA-methyltransferase
MAKTATPKTPASGQGKTIATLQHSEASRRNIPTAEYQSLVQKEAATPAKRTYPRNRDLDPQLMWRGKDEQDWSDLVVPAPPLYIQEKVHPKVLLDDLLRQTKADKQADPGQADLFGDFNGIPQGADKTDFYHHDQNWTNRMILGDSLQVMASLAEREGLAGKVQCIYFDPPYGIKFNSNFQWSTTSRDVKDGNAGHITREPEQVKAFRDTWRDGIHSYLTYLRDRLTVARDLLTESGSIFVQISEENVHRVRSLMDEVLGENNFATMITFQSTTSLGTVGLSAAGDHVLWYNKCKEKAKYRPLMRIKAEHGNFDYYSYLRRPDGLMWRANKDELQAATFGVFFPDNITSQRPLGDGDLKVFDWKGKGFRPGKGTFKTELRGLIRLGKADRLYETSGNVLRYVRLVDDYPVAAMHNIWTDTGTGSFTESKVYVVQTNSKIIERCILMATDPGDLVLDPTCGSGTTAYVAEQWGRRWITIDTSRVALALARARIMGARYPFYLLADSREGQLKEAEITRSVAPSTPVRGNIRLGFVNERVPHVTLKSIANNAEIDVIWDKWQASLEPLREGLNAAVGKTWQEWEIPREADAKWPDAAKKLHADWWQARISRQKEIDASIAAKAEFEHLYDKPYQDNKKVRVAGPFTVESLSPHRVLALDENDDLIDGVAEPGKDYSARQSFPEMILDNLKTAGVQQAHKADRITFTSLTPWPGDLICGEGRYQEGDAEKRAAIFIGPEFGTVGRQDLVEAAREAADSDFDVLIACAFNYEAHASEFSKLGRIQVLKARMNADLHMGEDLKNTGKGNLFVIFGEPDIDLLPQPDGRLKVKVKGIDVFKPQTGEVTRSEPDELACWFIDTDYNGESFFVRHAYFLGANDPYTALKTTLRAEINEEAWASLHGDTSRAFEKPGSGRIAVKVINHLGDEVMKVFRV